MMTEDELVVAVDSEVRQAMGKSFDELAEQRAKAVEYYYGNPYGDEKPDRAQVVTREVLDTIEWIKPELMKLFASGGDTVRFDPQGPDDVAQADQETDYCNYLLHRKNEGFKIIYQWITDGLLQKNGIVKAWYSKSRARVREEYEGLTQVEYLAMASDPDIEIIESAQRPSPVALEMLKKQEVALQQAAEQNPQGAAQALQQLQNAPIPQVYDCTVIRTGGEGGIKIENVPPEEFLMSRNGKSTSDTPFCAHRRLVTISELREMGYDDLDDIGSSDDGSTVEAEKIARHSVDSTWSLAHTSNEVDESMREVYATEAFIRVDYDGDGIAELRRVFKVGSRILDNEEVDYGIFCSWTPIILSHKFHGLSIADLTMDLQRIQSQLFRNILDNQYLANNGRYVAIESQVNLDDLMTSRPHGVIRAKIPNAVQRLDTPQLGATAFQMLGYVDQLRERRTGVSERTQGLDPTQLGPNTAASAVGQVMNAAQQRIELIARVFAETGLRELFLLLHKLATQNATQKEVVRLRGNYVAVDPSTWKNRTETSVVVGLGNGSKDQEMLHLGMILQNQMQLLSNPSTAQLVSPKNVYETCEAQVKVFNKAAAGRHFTDPSSEEGKAIAAQAGQMAAQAQAQAQATQAAAMQMEGRKLAVQEFKAQSSDQNEKARIQIEQAEHVQDQTEHVDEMTLERQKLSAEIALERSQDRGVDIG